MISWVASKLLATLFPPKAKKIKKIHGLDTWLLFRALEDGHLQPEPTGLVLANGTQIPDDSGCGRVFEYRQGWFKKPTIIKDHRGEHHVSHRQNERDNIQRSDLTYGQA